jgi:hypothetical protein
LCSGRRTLKRIGSGSARSMKSVKMFRAPVVSNVQQAGLCSDGSSHAYLK